ncbi:MAG: sigma-70 family RNA polymerase sigma factor [Candidatus Marinimicrobia bacterium]|nr:sigma-70 family RNA polymerase sigma factor [Candidatus Neomarinimicrobiota bacterium]MBT3501724.1 sigma-70 family RNA polymerase sigma factor [Candidatus Neomarinimicrobiota bacterium]MBT3839691.1 sigma-70 family RNA polymerase sigma factor [Candidatus Neomarinimicrobiota bacterium]MBT3999109.1 sigma-70 family RNA polymerase sigma factor [Candidatus Neomarinimicrobiota bacterium]MBT4282316.1 sigma-70 family RNA polymerase sigma factor [Candidatus Neomarinimicrobiota bacterium]
MEINEKALIEKAKEGDQSALSNLIHEHSTNVYNTGLKILQNKAEAEDVLQETFLIMIKKIQSFEGKSSLSTWLYRVATNVALGKIRENKKLGNTLELDALDYEPLKGSQIKSWPTDLEKRWKDESIKACLERSLAELPTHFRLVFILRDLEGYSVESAAKSLGISKSNVKVRLMRARLFIRDKLATNLHCVEAVS